nr:tetratricopeptide repeat protein [Cytophagales bacterium]
METDKYSNFEKYLEGDMTAEEKRAFEKNLEEDPEFKQDFILYRRIEEEMSAFYGVSAEEDILRNSLENVRRDFVRSNVDKKPKQVYLIPFLKGVAAAVLLFSGVYLLYLTVSNDLSEEVSTYYAAHYATLYPTMGSAEEGIQQGIAVYIQGDYEAAASIFSGVLDEEPDNSEALKNLGITFLAMKDYASALRAFEQYGNIPDLQVNDGILLQAITLLMRGEAEDLEKAENLLEKIISGDLDGKVQAEAWLKKL